MPKSQQLSKRVFQKRVFAKCPLFQNGFSPTLSLKKIQLVPCGRIASRRALCWTNVSVHENLKIALQENPTTEFQAYAYKPATIQCLACYFFFFLRHNVPACQATPVLTCLYRSPAKLLEGFSPLAWGRFIHFFFFYPTALPPFACLVFSGCFLGKRGVWDREYRNLIARERCCERL